MCFFLAGIGSSTSCCCSIFRSHRQAALFSLTFSQIATQAREMIRSKTVILQTADIRQKDKTGSPSFPHHPHVIVRLDRKSTRLNSSHVRISYAVFCLKKKK